jgi:hypothetical protein
VEAIWNQGLLLWILGLGVDNFGELRPGTRWGPCASKSSGGLAHQGGSALDGRLGDSALANIARYLPLKHGCRKPRFSLETDRRSRLTAGLEVHVPFRRREIHAMFKSHTAVSTDCELSMEVP